VHEYASFGEFFWHGLRYWGHRRAGWVRSGILLIDRYCGVACDRQTLDRLENRVLASRSLSGGWRLLAVNTLRPLVLTLTAFRSGLVTFDSPLFASLASKSRFVVGASRT
jgi:hypothetical protein